MRGKRPVRQDRRPKTTTFSAVDQKARLLKCRPVRQHAIRNQRCHLSAPGPTSSGAWPGPLGLGFRVCRGSVLFRTLGKSESLDMSTQVLGFRL